MDLAFRARLAGALGAPGWVAAAAGDRNGSFAFSGLEDGLRLPPGLLAANLEFLASPALRRLPQRLWGYRLEVAQCPRLGNLPRRARGFHILRLEDCPGLREVPACLCVPERVELRRCAALERVRLARSLERLELTSLPALRHLSRGLAVGRLELWCCPALTSLAGLRAIAFLSVQGCHRLTRLPQAAPEVEGRVRDCPALAPGWWTGDHPGITYEPRTGSAGLPPAPMPPSRQRVTTRPLPGLTLEEPEPWPWPPAGQTPEPVPAPLAALLGALAMGPLEQARCLGGPAGMEAGVRTLLLGEPDPGAAVQLATRMLQDARGPWAEPEARAVCMTLEALNLGTRSALLGLEKDAMRRLGPVLGPETCGPHRRNHEALARVAEAAEVLEGPLVLVDPAGPGADRIRFHEVRVTECPAFRELQGPVWAACALRIVDCPDLEVLPDLMVVHGDLEIADCPALRTFPARLRVGGDLILARLPRLVALACRAEVGGSIRMVGVPGLELERRP